MTLEQMALILISVLVTIAMGLAGWCLKQMVDLKVQFANHQGAEDAREKSYERRFAEIRDENHKTYGELKEDLSEIKRSVDAVHARIDKIVGGRIQNGG